MPAVQVLQVLSQVENDAITTAFLHEQILSFQDLHGTSIQCQKKTIMNNFSIIMQIMSTRIIKLPKLVVGSINANLH